VKLKSILLIFLGLSIQFAMAERIDSLSAEKIAKNFYFQLHQNGFKSTLKLELVQSYSSTVQNVNGDSSTQVPLIYIFKPNNTDGFVLVSGDDRVIPILGYSSTASFSKINMPPALQKLIENYKDQILYAQAHELVATPEIEEQWYRLSANVPNPSKSSTIVSPLLGTIWNQSPFYNDFCPYNSGLSKRTITGCVATAMAQIMKYWNYPEQGTGIHSYMSFFYGKQTANFASTTYNWAAMPDIVLSSNIAVATLMYHCGVSVDMNYGVNASGAMVIYDNGANPICAENAYKNYFRYDPSTIKGLKRINYSDSDWNNLLKKELNNGRPIQYAGLGTVGGHTFVCDGYDAQNYFHFNWGWSGYYDGYFNLTALNPGGTGGFNSGQQAIVGIQPLPAGTIGANIELYSSIIISPNPINFYSAFTVKADFKNAGLSEFNGDFCAAIFDSDGIFIDYVQIVSAVGNPLPAGYHYSSGITFSNVGLHSVPGAYMIGIYFRVAGGEWIKAGGTSYPNPVNTLINSPTNSLEQYSDISTFPSEFVQGQAAAINFNLKNTSWFTYYGAYSAVLYDLDGKFVQTIGTYNETNGLPAQSKYAAPYLNFICESITASPGTYMLAIIEKKAGSTNSYFVGGTYYKTPVKIIVVQAPLTPDSFEPNNTQVTASILALNWNNNAATNITTGSNNNTGEDVDFYRINLSSGFNYVITARLHDSYNSGNGNIYTNDVIWSYNKGMGWSEVYDDIMPGNIAIKGAGVVDFQVSPYFAGQTGTYLLDINVQRITNVGIKEYDNNVIALYPNPVRNQLTIDIGDNPAIKNFKILNSIGQVVYQSIIFNKSLIPMENFPCGVYLIRFETDKTVLSRKFIKQ